jgi:hypothetical protein
MKIDTQHSPLSPIEPVRQINIGLGIVVSATLHMLLIGALVHFTLFKAPQNSKPSVIQAQMIFPPLTKETLSTTEATSIAPESNTIREPEELSAYDIESKNFKTESSEKTNLVQQTKVSPPLAETQTILEEHSISQIPTATLPLESAIPTFDISELEAQTKEQLLKPKGDIGFIIEKAQGTDSLFSGLPSETEAVLHAIQIDKLEQSAQLSAKKYARSVISPELIAGPAPLTDAERTQKILQKSKIDIDCSSTLNQTLAVISQFTIQALHCRQNENFQKFINQRLAKVK